ncbi:MAG TPA: hypothetical protein ENH41_05105, partial [Candidatus Omnitrophica bacterium]|nr:hypothetical protein [Candidatus Omnitrophota bacterium]
MKVLSGGERYAKEVKLFGAIPLPGIGKTKYSGIDWLAAESIVKAMEWPAVSAAMGSAQLGLQGATLATIDYLDSSFTSGKVIDWLKDKEVLDKAFSPQNWRDYFYLRDETGAMTPFESNLFIKQTLMQMVEAPATGAKIGPLIPLAQATKYKLPLSKVAARTETIGRWGLSKISKSHQASMFENIALKWAEKPFSTRLIEAINAPARKISSFLSRRGMSKPAQVTSRMVLPDKTAGLLSGVGNWSSNMMVKVPIVVGAADSALRIYDAVLKLELKDKYGLKNTENLGFSKFQTEVVPWLALFALRNPSAEAGRDLAHLVTEYRTGNKSAAAASLKFIRDTKMSPRELMENSFKLSDREFTKVIKSAVGDNLYQMQQKVVHLAGKTGQGLRKEMFKRAKQIAGRGNDVGIAHINKAVRNVLIERENLSGIQNTPKGIKGARKDRGQRIENRLEKRLNQAAEKHFGEGFDVNKISSLIDVQFNFTPSVSRSIRYSITSKKMVDAVSFTKMLRNKIIDSLPSKAADAFRISEIGDIAKYEQLKGEEVGKQIFNATLSEIDRKAWELMGDKINTPPGIKEYNKATTDVLASKTFDTNNFTGLAKKLHKRSQAIFKNKGKLQKISPPKDFYQSDIVKDEVARSLDFDNYQSFSAAQDILHKDSKIASDFKALAGLFQNTASLISNASPHVKTKTLPGSLMPFVDTMAISSKMSSLSLKDRSDLNKMIENKEIALNSNKGKRSDLIDVRNIVGDYKGGKIEYHKLKDALGKTLVPLVMAQPEKWTEVMEKDNFTLTESINGKESDFSFSSFGVRDGIKDRWESVIGSVISRSTDNMDIKEHAREFIRGVGSLNRQKATLWDLVEKSRTEDLFLGEKKLLKQIKIPSELSFDRVEA